MIEKNSFRISEESSMLCFTQKVKSLIKYPSHKARIFLVPWARLELARPFDPRILSPLRIPFRHHGF